MVPQSPEESTLGFAVARRLVSPQQVAQARAAAAAGHAPNALAALASQLDPQQRAVLTQVYQQAQQGGRPDSGSWPVSSSGSHVGPAVAPTVNAPPPQFGVAPTVNAPPPQFGVAPTVNAPPPQFGDGATLMRPPPGQPVPSAAAVAVTRLLEREGIENSLANSVSRTGPGSGAERVGDYEIVREIARGGVGVVYLARHPTLERMVALKLLLPGTDVSVEALERFKLEAQVSSRLQHPNIVRIYQDGHDQRGRYYFAMDFIEGPSLLERIQQRGQLPSREAAKLLLPLAQGLAHAHRSSVLHRDLKPHNVLIRESDETPFLTDFGLAKDVGGTAKSLTVEGNVMGTPAYMPPEQAGGETDLIDRRSDVYSLGATLYHALTGEAPFGGQTLANVLTAVLTKDVVPPSKKVKGVDPDLETICLTCLEKEQDERYPSAQALADDLERYLADKPILARPTGALGRVRKWARRNRGMAWTLAVSLLVLVVGGAVGGAYVLNERGRAEIERLNAVESARAKLVAAKKADYDRARSSLKRVRADAPSGLHIAAALETLTAAQLWLGLAGGDPQAKQASISAALELCRFAEADRQWSLAAQALEIARAAGESDEVVDLRLAEVKSARDAGLEAVKRVFAELRAGTYQGRLGWQDRAAFQIVRSATESELRPVLLEQLRGVTKDLREASAKLLRELAEPTEAERGRGETSLVGVDAEFLASLDAPPLAPIDPKQRERLFQTLRRARFRQKMGLLTPNSALEFGRRALAQAQFDSCKQGLDCAEVVCTVAEQLPVLSSELEVELIRYLRVLSDSRRGLAPARALLRHGSSEGLAGALSQIDSVNSDDPLTQLISASIDLGQLEAIRESELSSESEAGLALLSALLSARQGEYKNAVGVLSSPKIRNQRAVREARCRYLAELGRTEEAAEELLALKQANLPPLALKRLHAKVLVASHRWREAAEVLRKLAEETMLPDAKVITDQAVVAMHQGDVRQAFDFAIAASHAKANSASSARLIAVVLMRNLDAAGALRTIDDALRIRPRAWELLTLKADILAGRGDTAQALELLELARQDARFERHVDLSSARVEAQRGDFGRALEHVERALSQNQSWVPGLDLKAMLLAASGKAQACMQAIALAESAMPWDSEIKRRKYSFLIQLGKKAEAEAVLDELGLSTDPVALLTRAQHLRSEGDLLAAARTFRDAFMFRQNDPEIAGEYGRFLLHDQGRVKDAAEVLEHALKLAPKSALLWTDYGSACYQLGRVKEAKAAFTRAADIGGEALAFNNLGYLLQGEGELARALANYDLALDLNPTLVLALCNRGKCRWELGKRDGALEDYDRAAKLAPDDAEVRWSRAEALLQLGRDEDAARDLALCAETSAYAALCLAGLTGNTDAVRRFAARDEAWVCKISRTWLGDLSAELLLAGARESLPAQTRKERLCESHFYLGWLAERAGKHAVARAHYRESLAQGQTTFLEHSLAKLRLERLPD